MIQEDIHIAEIEVEYNLYFLQHQEKNKRKINRNNKFLNRINNKKYRKISIKIVNKAKILELELKIKMEVKTKNKVKVKVSNKIRVINKLKLK